MLKRTKCLDLYLLSLQQGERERDRSGRGISALQHFEAFNLVKPTGYVMHHQFNIQQLYALPTLYLCVLYLSENKQPLFPYTAQTDWFL
jgi:hypothetical protein